MSSMLLTPALPIVLAAALCGCVATQKIPVSTDPGGALVYLDGSQVCAATPCSVEIPKDQDHLLTIVKPGYRQRDVPVRRVYDAVGELRGAASKSVRATTGGSGADGVLSSTVENMNKRAEDGSAYVLEPRLVVLRLALEGSREADAPFDDPAAGPQQGARRRADGTLDPVELGLDIFRIIEGATQGAGAK